MTDRLLALEARKANLEQMAEPESMPRLHPKLAEVYRQHVERLEEDIERFHHPPRSDGRAPRADERRGDVRAELYGEMGAILASAKAAKKQTDIL